jgi:phosphatidylglycerophosphate synthase
VGEREAAGVTQVSMAQVRATYKQRDAWWTVLLVDPVAGRLLRLVAGTRWITPTRLTVAAFLIGMTAAAAFAQATAGWLLLGAVLYHASFIVDCVDGKLARLRGNGSILGSWLDFLLDRVRVFVCTVALFGGQYLHTDNEAYLLAATGVAFLALFGYLNGAETDRARAKMAGGPVAGSIPVPTSAPNTLLRIRGFLHRRRIRMNLVSGVEFEMAVFVVAPLAAAGFGSGAIMWVAGGAAGLLVAFELALMARFWVTARAYDRRTASRPVARTAVVREPRVDDPAGTPA